MTRPEDQYDGQQYEYQQPYPQQQYQQPYPPQQQPPTGNGTRAAILVVTGLIVAALLSFGGYLIWNSQQDNKSKTTATTVATAVTPGNNPASTAQADGADSREASTVTSTVTSSLVPPSSTPNPTPGGAGDLGLSTPISTPACDGSTIVVVENAVTPGQYAQDVAAALNRFPGASYMKTGEVKCASLRSVDDYGNEIYAIYYPGASLADTCATKSQVGGYARRLDNSTPTGTEIC